MCPLPPGVPNPIRADRFLVSLSWLVSLVSWLMVGAFHPPTGFFPPTERTGPPRSALESNGPLPRDRMRSREASTFVTLLPMRPSWIEIDLDAIESNVRVIREAISPTVVCAVVKADGYGHGDVPSAKAAIAGGATHLAVALVSEGVRLREAGIEAPILVLSEPLVEEIDIVVAWSLTPIVYRRHFVDAVGEAADRVGSAPYPVHLKVDTGMHRVGASPVEAIDLARRINADERLTLEGVATHLSVAEEDAEFTARQVGALAQFRDLLMSEGIDVEYVHAANTAGALHHAEARFDLSRIGLGIYGLRPAPETGLELDLKPAMRVVSAVSFVQRLPAGARPSYGRARALERPSTVATVPLGYADGIPRRLSSLGGEVLIHGRRYPFAGTVTMDQVMIDLGDDPVAVGDEVVFIGTQGDEEVTATEWADLLSTINYEVVCQFGPRLPRRYVRGGV
jgi:alanine racemase